jgi:hypothetical protein
MVSSVSFLDHFGPPDRLEGRACGRISPDGSRRRRAAGQDQQRHRQQRGAIARLPNEIARRDGGLREGFGQFMSAAALHRGCFGHEPKHRADDTDHDHSDAGLLRAEKIDPVRRLKIAEHGKDRVERERLPIRSCGLDANAVSAKIPCHLGVIARREL